MNLILIDNLMPHAMNISYWLLTYDPDDECVSCECDEGEDGVDDAEEDDDDGVVRLVLAHLVHHADGRHGVVGHTLVLLTWRYVHGVPSRW